MKRKDKKGEELGELVRTRGRGEGVSGEGQRVCREEKKE